MEERKKRKLLTIKNKLVMKKGHEKHHEQNYGNNYVSCDDS
jgi:hypothetical protein